MKTKKKYHNSIIQQSQKKSVFCWGPKMVFTTNFCDFFVFWTTKQSNTMSQSIKHSSIAYVSVSSTTRTLLLTINYFVVAHNATVTVCATSADCHLIVTLEILAMCPFIFRSLHTCWLWFFFLLCFLMFFHVFFSTTKRLSSYAILFLLEFSFQSASCLHLTWTPSTRCQSHTIDRRVNNRSDFLSRKRKKENKMRWNSSINVCLLFEEA